MRKWSWIVVLAVVWLLGACTTTERTKETSVIREISDNGCQIDKFETSTGPRGRSAITVECK